MSPLHLLWIIPVAFCGGFILCGLFKLGRDTDRIALELLAACRNVKEDLGFTEWASPEHAEETLSALIRKHCPPLAAAILHAEEVLR